MHRPQPGVVGGAVLTASCLALAACGSTASSTTAGGDPAGGGGGSVACGQMKIGMIGPITGPSSSFGQADRDSAQLAIDKFNADNPKCKVSLQLFDTKGDASAAPAAATKAVQDKDIVAILGPEFSGEVESAEPIFDRAGMPTVTSDATAVDLASHGWKVFHRTIGSDGVEAPGEAINTITDRKLGSIAVINNGESYGAGIAKAFAAVTPKLGGTVAMQATIDAAGSDYSSTVLAIKSSKAQAVYCGCLYPEAARLVKQLRKGGVTAPFVTDAGSVETAFTKLAGGAAANGAVGGIAGNLADRYGPAKQFLADYVSKYGEDASQTYAPQGYDAAQAILTAIGAGKHSRSQINAYLDTISFDGVSGHIKFLPNGNLDVDTVNIMQAGNDGWTYQKQVTVPDSLKIG